MLAKFALALSALALNVAAVPLEGRDYQKDGIVWHVKTEVVVETVDVYTTVYVQPPPKTVKVVATKTKTAGKPGSTYNPQAYHQHNHNKPKHSHKPKHSKKPSKAAPAPSATYKAAPAPAPTTKAAPAPVYSAPPPAPPAPKPATPVAKPQPTTSQAPPPPPPPPASTYKAPAPKTTQQPAPQPQPSYVAKPQPQAQPKPSSPSSSFTGGNTQGASLFQGYSGTLPGASHPFACAGGCKGDITFFNPSVGTGACGYTTGATDNDDVVAVSADMMGSLSSGDVMNPFCGKYVSITNPANGKTVKGKVTDKCPGCLASEDIDLSPALFKKLGAMGDGRIHNVKWEWVS